MYVRHLQLGSFRSWERVDLALAPDPVFVGRNGEGKTNLVEAVGYLATMSSHRVSSDAPLVRHGTPRRWCGRRCAAATGSCSSRSRSTRAAPTGCGSTAPRCRGPGTPRPGPHGALRARGPLARPRRPDRAPPLPRRAAGHPHPRLAGVRADYDRVLKQRNALLKTARLARGKAIETLDVWDGHLTDVGGQLLAARLQLVADLAPHMARSYADVAGPAGRRPHSATPRPSRWPVTAARSSPGRRCRRRPS